MDTGIQISNTISLKIFSLRVVKSYQEISVNYLFLSAQLTNNIKYYLIFLNNHYTDIIEVSKNHKEFYSRLRSGKFLWQLVAF